MPADSRVVVVKHNQALCRPGTRDESVRLLRDFFGQMQGKAPGLTGHLILTNSAAPEEVRVLTFWDSKAAMDSFYGPENRAFQDFVRSSQSLLQGPPARTDLEVSDARLP